MKKSTILLTVGGVVVCALLWYVLKEIMRKQIQKLIPVEELEKQFDDLVENQRAITEYLQRPDANKYLEINKN